MVEKVIWISSYPKSGNTWIHSVIREAGKNKGFPNADLDVYNLIRNKTEPKQVSCIYDNVTKIPCTVLKTHSPYIQKEFLHPTLKLSMAGFVHIIRNPFDMLLSYINFSRIQYSRFKDDPLYKRKLFKELLGFKDFFEYEDWKKIELEDIPKQNLDNALNFFASNGTKIPTLNISGDWLSHNYSWFNLRSNKKAVFMKYENCLDGIESFYPLTSIFKYNSHDLELAINYVYQKTLNVRSDSANNNDRIFYNKMAKYYYINFFSKKAIQRFLDKFQNELISFGYADLPY